MLHDLDIVINRWHTNSEKYDDLRKLAPKAPGNSTPPWITDMDFRTAPEIIAAVHKHVDGSTSGCMSIYDVSYYQTVCHWMEKHHHWHITPDEIMVDSGVIPALSHALSLITGPGDGVVIYTPTYKPLFNSIRNTGTIPVYTRLCRSHGLSTIDLEDLEQKTEDESNKVLVLYSPYNPTGCVWSQEELSCAVGICRKHNLFTVCNEIHSGVLRLGICYTSLAGLYPDMRQLITYTTPSRTFNLAGNHLASIIVPDRGIHDCWSSLYHYLPNPISVAVAMVTYERGESWLDELNQYLAENSRWMETCLKANLPAIGFQIPETTYLAWINTKSLDPDHGEIENRPIENGLIIKDEDQFMEDGGGFIRLSTAVPRSVIDTLLNKINHIFN